MTKRYPFETDGRYFYDFTTQGLFTLVNREGESLYDQVIPLCEKLGSHLLWIFLWISIISLSPPYLDRFFMGAIIAHLFFFGCRLTTLLLRGGIFPILFPPLWVRLTRKMQRGWGEEVLKKYNLERHPGLLTNLALIQFHRNETEKGRHSLRRAHTLCVDHPLIGMLVEELDLNEGQRVRFPDSLGWWNGRH